jgi:cysteine desulfurase
MISGRPVYLDNNATTPMDPQVFAAMTPWFMEQFGNAASATHLYGWEARDAVDEARERVATLIGADPREIIFTSGATESVNLALKGVSELPGRAGGHIITCATEHRAVLDTCRHLERSGFDVTYLPTASNGLIDTEELIAAIRPSTMLIALMYVNNETGVIQPIREVASLAQQHGITFFCDATQAVGKMPLDMHREGIDLMAFSAHKMHGPKGIGALYLRRNSVNPVRPVPQMDGGGHEWGFRSGTLNVPAIVGFGKASLLCLERMQQDRDRLSTLRDRLEAAMLQIPGTRLNGHREQRLHQVSNIAFDRAEGQSMMLAISRHVAISSGSACSSVTQEPSHVLKAMGLTDHLARNSFRFSLGRFTTEDDIEKAIEAVMELAPK